MKSTRYLILIVFLSCFSLFACTTELEPTVMPTVTKSATAIAIITKTVTRTITPTPSRTMTNMPVVPVPTRTYSRKDDPTRTATTTRTQVPMRTPRSLLQEDQPLPGGAVINLENVSQLELVAEWGKGEVIDIAFAPDGKTFVVASSQGYMIYDANDTEVESHWVPFEKPFPFDELFFNDEGDYLKFYWEIEPWTQKDLIAETYFSYLEGVSVPALDGRIWFSPQVRPTYLEVLYDDAVSSDEKYKFKRNTDNRCNPPDGKWYNEYITEEPHVGAMFDNKTGVELYQVDTDVPCLVPEDTIPWEACDFRFFTPCGNSIQPYSLYPSAFEFSVSGESFAMHLNGTGHSYVRIYDLTNGERILQIGAIGQPILGFAYSPDGTQMAVTFEDGTIELWDIAEQETLYSRKDFNSDIEYLMISHDGQYLFAQRENQVDVREMKTGNLLYQKDSIVSDVSPIEDYFATSEEQGMISIRENETGNILYQLDKHYNALFDLVHSENGRYLLSSGNDCQRLVWDMENIGSFVSLEPSYDDSNEPKIDSRVFIYDFNVLEDSGVILGYGSWGTTSSWDLTTGELNYIVSPGYETWLPNGYAVIDPRQPSVFYVEEVTDRFFIWQRSYEIKTGYGLGDEYSPNFPDENCYMPNFTVLDGSVELGVGKNNKLGHLCVSNPMTMAFIDSIPLFPVDKTGDLAITQLLISPDGTRIIALSAGETIYMFQINE